ncbi:MAG: hypothetical protein EOM44_07975 [Bacteroidia bacterium]|nr:hypothetical protein [Bacteroidia bacterium]
MKWIEISNERPKPQEQLLVLISNRVASVVKFNGFNFTDDGLDVDDVTHWCYLPEIPILKRELLREG